MVTGCRGAPPCSSCAGVSILASWGRGPPVPGTQQAALPALCRVVGLSHPCPSPSCTVDSWGIGVCDPPTLALVYQPQGRPCQGTGVVPAWAPKYPHSLGGRPLTGSFQVRTLRP